MPSSILAQAVLHEPAKTLTAQEAMMQTLRTHFNHKPARKAGWIS
jgi:hypothetical protein